MSNDLALDLPLQINKNFFNLQKFTGMRSKDMPKQMKNDVYRQPRAEKQNLIDKQEYQARKIKVQLQDQKIFGPKNLEQTKENNRSSHLRAILKKKLLASEREAQNGRNLKSLLTKNQQKTPLAQIKLNRYQMLLSQFYGTPSKDNSKFKSSLIKGKNPSQNNYQMKRHQSVRNIDQIFKTGNKQLPLGTLGRYRSQSTLPRLPINQEVKKTRKNSNIKSQISKIPTYLDLYKQKKRLMLTE